MIPKRECTLCSACFAEVEDETISHGDNPRDRTAPSADGCRWGWLTHRPRGTQTACRLQREAYSAEHEMRSDRSAARKSRCIEQFVTIATLRVGGILDLQPGCGTAIGSVRAACKRGHDAFEIRQASDHEQIRAALVNVIETQQAALNSGHDAPQATLPLEQRQCREIFALDTERIEGVEVRSLAAEQQLVEMRPAVRLQAADLAIEHGRVRAHGVGDFLGELRPLPERVTVA